MIRHLCALLLLWPALALAQTREQTAGIYYAYPEPQPAEVAVPQGYEPVYASHYGRHGSRWITDDYRYLATLAPFDTLHARGMLTELGEDVRLRLHRVADDALGRSGSLSPLGEQQHRGIAERLAWRCPQLFADSARVDAASSTSVRCVMSMAAFSERLKELNPNLRVQRTAHNKNMDFIAYTSPEGKAFSDKSAPWWEQHRAYVAEQVRPERLMASLFADPSLLLPEEQSALMEALYWVASDMQDVGVGEDFYDIFTLDELQGIWRTINARMYACNGDAPINKGVMKHCADHLLSEIIASADAALAGDGPAANLRFGHDTHLLRLLALMGVEAASGQAAEMERYCEVWRDYELSPMAANLQLVFYRNADGDVLVLPLLNERLATFPIGPGPLYSWPDLRAFWESQL